MNCDCGCAEFWKPDNNRIEFVCHNCGQLYTWTGSYISKVRGIKIYCGRVTDDS